MGNYLNPDNSKFQEALNSDIYVDKTGLIRYTNSVLTHFTEEHMCQQTKTFRKVYGCKYADSILQ